MVKAYKYHHSSYNGHWSMSSGGTLIYVPKFNIILYDGSQGSNHYSGVHRDEKVIKTSKLYIEEVKSGKIPKYKNSKVETWLKEGKITIEENPHGYSNVIIHDKKLEEVPTSIGKGYSNIGTPKFDRHNDIKTYVKNIGKNGSITTLESYEEIELEITKENVDTWIREGEDLERLRSGLKTREKSYSNNLIKFFK